MSILDGQGNEAQPETEKPAEGNTAEQKHGVCPHCAAEQKGLVFDFFSNLMQVAGKVAQVEYTVCSCAACGKMISVGVLHLAEAEVQPGRPSLVAPGFRRRHN